MKMVVAYFKVLSQHLHGEAEKTTNTCQNSRSPDRDLNPGLPAWKAGVLTTGPRHSVAFEDICRQSTNKVANLFYIYMNVKNCDIYKGNVFVY
jgi:hypothetical protein